MAYFAAHLRATADHLGALVLDHELAFFRARHSDPLTLPGALSVVRIGTSYYLTY